MIVSFPLFPIVLFLLGLKPMCSSISSPNCLIARSNSGLNTSTRPAFFSSFLHLRACVLAPCNGYSSHHQSYCSLRVASSSRGSFTVKLHLISFSRFPAPRHGRDTPTHRLQQLLPSSLPALVARPTAQACSLSSSHVQASGFPFLHGSPIAHVMATFRVA